MRKLLSTVANGARALGGRRPQALAKEFEDRITFWRDFAANTNHGVPQNQFPYDFYYILPSVLHELEAACSQFDSAPADHHRQTAKAYFENIIEFIQKLDITVRQENPPISDLPEAEREKLRQQFKKNRLIPAWTQLSDLAQRSNTNLDNLSALTFALLMAAVPILLLTVVPSADEFKNKQDKLKQLDQSKFDKRLPDCLNELLEWITQNRELVNGPAKDAFLNYVTHALLLIDALTTFNPRSVIDWKSVQLHSSNLQKQGQALTLALVHTPHLKLTQESLETRQESSDIFERLAEQVSYYTDKHSKSLLNFPADALKYIQQQLTLPGSTQTEFKTAISKLIKYIQNNHARVTGTNNQLLIDAFTSFAHQALTFVQQVLKSSDRSPISEQLVQLKNALNEFCSLATAIDFQTSLASQHITELERAFDKLIVKQAPNSKPASPPPTVVNEAFTQAVSNALLVKYAARGALAQCLAGQIRWEILPTESNNEGEYQAKFVFTNANGQANELVFSCTNQAGKFCINAPGPAAAAQNEEFAQRWNLLAQLTHAQLSATKKANEWLYFTIGHINPPSQKALIITTLIHAGFHGVIVTESDQNGHSEEKNYTLDRNNKVIEIDSSRINRPPAKALTPEEKNSAKAILLKLGRYGYYKQNMQNNPALGPLVQSHELTPAEKKILHSLNYQLSGNELTKLRNEVAARLIEYKNIATLTADSKQTATLPATRSSTMQTIAGRIRSAATPSNLATLAATAAAAAAAPENPELVAAATLSTATIAQVATEPLSHILNQTSTLVSRAASWTGLFNEQKAPALTHAPEVDSTPAP